jgi:hypothetical protein
LDNKPAIVKSTSSYYKSHLIDKNINRLLGFFKSILQKYAKIIFFHNYR